jgi:hypothetical protein
MTFTAIQPRTNNPPAPGKSPGETKTRVSTTNKGKENRAVDRGSLRAIAHKPRKQVTGVAVLQPEMSATNGEATLAKIGKIGLAPAAPVEAEARAFVPEIVVPMARWGQVAMYGLVPLGKVTRYGAPGITVASEPTGIAPIPCQMAGAVAIPDEDSSSLVESSEDCGSRVESDEESSSLVESSEDSSSENKGWASETASELTDSYGIDGTQPVKVPLARQVPARRTPAAPSRAAKLSETNSDKVKASLKAYCEGMLKKASGAKETGVADQLKNSAFSDSGPVEFIAALRTECRDFFRPMEQAIERSFDAALIRKAVKPRPASPAGHKQLANKQQEALDAAQKNVDLGPMARFGKNLAHTLVAPLTFDARIKARLKGESFSQAAARAAFDRFPGSGKTMLKDMVAAFWQLDDFHKLTPTEQETTLRDAVTACIVTYGANNVSLDSVRDNFAMKPELADGISAMALAQTYLKASFGLQHAVRDDSGAIANLVSSSEKKRASAFIDALLDDACTGYVSAIVDPYSNAYAATAETITSTMLQMVKDKPASVDTKFAADVPRMNYALVSKSGTVDLPRQPEASEKQTAERIEKVLSYIGHQDRHRFRRRIALCATQEMKNAVINLAFASDGRFLQNHPGCFPRLDMTTKVSIERVSNDRTKVRLEGFFDGAGKSVELRRGGFETIGELKDFRMRYVTEVTISDLHGDLPIKLGQIRFTMENLTVHPAG